MPPLEDTIKKYGNAWAAALNHVSLEKHVFYEASEVLREAPKQEMEEDSDVAAKRAAEKARLEREAENKRIEDISGQRVVLYDELKRFYNALNEALDTTVENEQTRDSLIRDLNADWDALLQAGERFNDVVRLDLGSIDDSDGFPDVPAVVSKDGFLSEKNSVEAAKRKYDSNKFTVSTHFPRLSYNKNDKKFQIAPLELYPTNDPKDPDYITSILNAKDIRDALQDEVYKLIRLIMTQDIAESASKTPIKIDEGSKEVITEHIIYLLLLERDLNGALKDFSKGKELEVLPVLLDVFKKHEEQRNKLFKLGLFPSLERFFKSLTAIIVSNITTAHQSAFSSDASVCDDSLKFSEWLSSWLFLAVDHIQGPKKFENFLIKRLAYQLNRAAEQYSEPTFTADVLKLQDNSLQAYLKFVHKIISKSHISDYTEDSRAYILIKLLSADPDLRKVVFDDRLPEFTEGGKVSIDAFVKTVKTRHLRSPGIFNPYAFTSTRSAAAPSPSASPGPAARPPE